MFVFAAVAAAASSAVAQQPTPSVARRQR